jgi:hypothetical protein
MPLGRLGATDIDLVQRHAELGRKVLLNQRARLVLHLEMLFEHVVLLLGQARLHIALRRLLQLGVRMRGPAYVLGRAGRVHGHDAATLVSRDLGRMRNRQLRWRFRGEQSTSKVRPGAGDDALGTGFGARREQHGGIIR